MIDYFARVYQDRMGEFALATPKCGLWADMGLGKSVVTATVIESCLYSANEFGERWLIVGPKRVARRTWPKELSKWNHTSGIPYRVLTNEDFGLTNQDVLNNQGELTFLNKREDKKRLQSYREPVHIVSYEQFVWLVKAYGVNWPYSCVVFDESTFLKGQGTKRFQAARHIASACSRVIELTGMPTPNGYLDLWSQIYLLDQGKRLGRNYTDYRNEFFVADQRNQHQIFSYKLRAGARDLIQGRLSDICVSFRSEDWLDLPEMIENDIVVELPESAREQYEALEREFMALVDGGQILGLNAAALRVKMLQLASGSVYDGKKVVRHSHDAKIDALGEMLDSVSGNVLLAYVFQHDYDRIKKRFRFARHVDDPGALDDFEKGKIKLLCTHPASAAHGLDGLQLGASTVCWFGLTPNLEHYTQLNKRLHRSGQKAGRVMIQRIIADGTDDWTVDSILKSKGSEHVDLMLAMKERIERKYREQK